MRKRIPHCLPLAIFSTFIHTSWMRWLFLKVLIYLKCSLSFHFFVGLLLIYFLLVQWVSYRLCSYVFCNYFSQLSCLKLTSPALYFNSQTEWSSHFSFYVKRQDCNDEHIKEFNFSLSKEINFLCGIKLKIPSMEITRV